MPDPLDIPLLTDDVVTLRAHRTADADAVLERCVDPDSVRWTTVPLEYTRSMAVEYLGGLGPSPTKISWAVDVDDRYAGTVDLRSWGRTPDGALVAGDLGFVTHPWGRGRGIMSRAVRLVVGHAFDTLGWETVVWQANVGNVASYKAVWRVGFPVPIFVPSSIAHRGRAVDGWHSALHHDDPREPTVEWNDAQAELQRHMAVAEHPG